MKMNDDDLKIAVQSGADIREGDRVKLLSGGGDSPLCGFYDGDIYTVGNPNYVWGRASREIKIELTNGDGGSGYADKHQIEVFQRAR